MKAGFLRERLLDKKLAVDPPPGQKIKIPSEALPMHLFPSVQETNPHENILFCTLPPHDPSRPNDPETQCLLRQGMKEKILAIPGFPQPVAVPDRARYMIKPIRGLGMNLVATIDIDVGELIMAERPLIVSLLEVPQTGRLFVQQPAEMQRMLIERLTPENREDFFALRNCKGYTRPEITGITDSNGLGIEPLPGDGRNGAAAICKIISRVNHSCCTNATWAFRLESFAVELRAVMPIKKGERITIAYDNVLQPRAERQKFLMKRYKFKCNCLACVDDESEQLRENLISASQDNPCRDESTLRSWLSDRETPDDLIVAECLKMIELLDRAKFYDPAVWPVWYQRIVKAYCALEDKKNAKKWAEKAAKLCMAYRLSECGWDAVAKDPKNTDWWGLRRKMRNGMRMGENLEDIKFQKVTENMGGPMMSYLLLDEADIRLRMRPSGKSPS